MIVKVQKALAGAGAGAGERLLIYDEPRELFMEIDAAPSLVGGLLGNDLKAYFEARVTPKGELSINGRVEDQPW